MLYRLRNHEDVIVPHGVLAYLMHNPPYGGVFMTPSQAKVFGEKSKIRKLTYFPTILVPLDVSRQLLLHEIGHFLHWKQHTDFGMNCGHDERMADKLGRDYYKSLTGKRISIRNKMGNIR